MSSPEEKSRRYEMALREIALFRPDSKSRLDSFQQIAIHARSTVLEALNPKPVEIDARRH